MLLSWDCIIKKKFTCRASSILQRIESSLVSAPSSNGWTLKAIKYWSKKKNIWRGVEEWREASCNHCHEGGGHHVTRAHRGLVVRHARLHAQHLNVNI